MIEIRALTTERGVRRRRRSAEAHLEFRRYRTAAGAPVRGRQQSRRPGLRRLRSASAWSAFCSRFPASSAGAQSLSAQPYAGRAAGISRPRHRPHAEAETARRCPGARHRPGGVDLRSARNQERLLQYGAPGRHRAPLRGEPVRHHFEPAARRPAHRSLHRGMVGGERPREVDSGRQAGGSQRRARNASRCRPRSPRSARPTPSARARSRRASPPSSIATSIAAWR